VNPRALCSNYTYADAEHINVPLDTDNPHKVTMNAASSIELKPLIDAQPAALDDLYATSPHICVDYLA